MSWMMTAALESVKAMLMRIAESAPRLFGAILILVIGWLIARAVKWALIKALKTVPFDEFSRKLHIADFLQKGEVRYQLSELIGVTAYWLILLAFLLAALDALGMTVAAQLLEKVLDYVPQVLAGVIVLILGLFFSAVLGGIVQTAAANAGIGQARALSQIARVAVIIFAVAVALEKFFSSMIIQTTFTIVLTAVGLAFALAFGLGCKEIAGRAVADFLDEIRGGR